MRGLLLRAISGAQSKDAGWILLAVGPARVSFALIIFALKTEKRSHQSKFTFIFSENESEELLQPQDGRDLGL